jgi:hypothetical protein
MTDFIAASPAICAAAIAKSAKAAKPAKDLL